MATAEVSCGAQHVGCTLAEYHARDEVSASQIRDALVSWALYYGRHVARPPLFPRQRTAAMDLGTVGHAASLDVNGMAGVARLIPPHALNSAGNRMGKNWSAWSKSQKPSMILLKPEEWDVVKQMVASLEANPEAAELLRHATHREHTLIWHDEVPCRARPDLLSELPDQPGVLLCELKFWSVDSEAEIPWRIARFGVHYQLAWYRDALFAGDFEVAGARLIVVQTKPPYRCWVGEVSRDDIDDAAVELASLRSELAVRLAENDWTDRDARRLHAWHVPDWAKAPVTITAGGEVITL